MSICGFMLVVFVTKETGDLYRIFKDTEFNHTMLILNEVKLWTQSTCVTQQWFTGFALSGNSIIIKRKVSIETKLTHHAKFRMKGIFFL